jgi:hypothetical protein
MQGLKILIGVMTLLIALGLGLLVYGMATLGFTEKQSEASLTLPKDATIEGMSATDKTVTLHIRDAGNNHSIYTVTTGTGKVKNRLNIVRE